jgi:hypothetical protein
MPYSRLEPGESKSKRRVFISHSYADRYACDRIVATLPSDVEPVVFPPIRVSPEDMVSTPLLAALRGCDELIYLTGGASDRSFWVAFDLCGQSRYIADYPHCGEAAGLARVRVVSP